MSAPYRVDQLSRSPLDRMIEAVEIEAATVSKRDRKASVLVTDGIRIAPNESGAIYNFRIVSGGGARPSDEARVRGEFGDVGVDGVIIGGNDDSLSVALKADLGPTIPAGQITVDTTWLWTALCDRLAQLRTAYDSATVPVNIDNLRILTGERPPTLGLGVPSPFSHCGPALNDEQERLYRQAVGSSAVFGWGPPGTGKTVVCTRLIADGFYAGGKSCLYTGPTNKAVDLGLARTLERLAVTRQLDEAVAAGHIVRVGPISDPTLRSMYGALISLDVLVAARLIEIAAERTRWFAAEIEALSDLKAAEDTCCAPSDDESRRDIQGQARSAMSRLETARRHLKVLDEQAAATPHEILRRARIVATTVHRVYLGQVPRLFDAVVLDEAGMITLPAACCAAAHAELHLAVMGDFRQLGAIVTSTDRRVREWVARDAFRAVGIVDAVERRRPAPGLVMLRVQHRSDPAIAAVWNAVTYKHAPLVTHPSVLQRTPLPSPWGTEPLMLLDSSPFRPFVQTARNSQSRNNRVHAALVRWWLQELDAAGGVPGDPDDSDGVVVLTPFRDQVRLLREHLPKSLLARAVDVCTIHTYQGGERGTVVLDLVDARGLSGLSRFLQATTLDDDGARLVGVAASRARRRLVVVASLNYVLHRAQPGPIQDFVRHIARHAKRIQVPPELAAKAHTYVESWERRDGDRRKS